MDIFSLQANYEGFYDKVCLQKKNNILQCLFDYFQSNIMFCDFFSYS